MTRCSAAGKRDDPATGRERISAGNRAERALTIEKLGTHRERTEIIARLLHERLATTLASILEQSSTSLISPSSALDEVDDLSLVTLRAPPRAFRPADDLIASATRLSGVPAFIALIDLEARPWLRDPLVERIQHALAKR